MSIIKLSEPWCFNTEELTEEEVEKLQNHFVKVLVNYNYSWNNANKEQIYVGITSNGLSDYFDCISSFDKKDEDENNVTVYTIEQLRAIITEHLAKQPVEKLEDGVVYHSVYGELNYLFVNEKEWINLSSKMFYSGGMSWENMHESPTHVMTKATPAQIAHYEACVKAGKYVEPEEELEKWSIGTYIVVVRKDAGILLSKHTVAKIKNSTANCVYVNEDVISKQREDNGSIKWFPTLQEAEEFAKSLEEPVYLDEAIEVEKEAVHCTTQEEWNFALSKFNPAELDKNDWLNYTHTSYINLKEGTYGSMGSSTRVGYTILTFQQWCDKYGHTYEVVPEYVECISSTESHYYKVGKVYTWPDTITEQGKHNKPNVLKGSIWKFKPSTKEAYDKQQENLKMEELLSEAKLKFPIGTKFKCYVSRSVVHEVKDLSLFVINSGHIFYEHQMVYNGTIWAEIVKEEPKVTEIKPAKGMYVRCLKQNTWGDGKTEVGQVLKIEDVSSYGDMWVNNQSLAIQRIQRREFELLPDYKEEPWVAQVGDWVYITEGEKYGSDLKTGAVVQCTEWESDFQQFGKNLSTWTYPKHYRKATQEEIDSVTKPIESKTLKDCKDFEDTVKYIASEYYDKELVDKFTEQQWTADNWYVEVTSQEEANAVIDAAAKMHGKPYDKSFVFEEEWKYVGLRKKNKDFTILRIGLTHDGAKPRPISDFIQVTTKEVTVDSFKAIYARYISDEDFTRLKNPYQPQQDELVIYKPKRLIL